MLIAAYIAIVVACIMWRVDLQNSYVTAIIIAVALTTQAAISYAPVKRAENDPIVGYLLALHNLVSKHQLSPAEQARQEQLRTVREKYQFEAPGFAEEQSRAG